MTAEILIVDDDTSHRRMLEAVLNGEGYAVTHASDGMVAVEAVSEKFYDLILMDIRMSRMDGIEALHRIKEISPGIPVIIMTAYAAVDTAVGALKSGAFDYLTKPLDIDELKILVEKAMRFRRLEQENRFLRERLGTRFDFANIVGESPPMKRLFETISLVAPSDATVLISGESGTGKELIANAIHQNSGRKDKPFIKVNCAALPETLLESELFGHEKGAFTGAAQKKQGRFQLAHTGSIFLDEIAETATSTQVKLLRVLQEQEFEPLGGTRSVKVDIRVIAATNRDMALEIRDGRFREDLFYRLNVVAVTLPPLRDRREDILPLAEHFLGQYARKKPPPDQAVHTQERGSPDAAHMAGKRPRTGKRRGKGRHSLPRRRHRPRRPAGRRPIFGKHRKSCRHGPETRSAAQGDGKADDPENPGGNRRQPDPRRGNSGHQPEDPAEQAQGVWDQPLNRGWGFPALPCRHQYRKVHGKPWGFRIISLLKPPKKYYTSSFCKIFPLTCYRLQ